MKNDGGQLPLGGLSGEVGVLARVRSAIGIWLRFSLCLGWNSISTRSLLPNEREGAWLFSRPVGRQERYYWGIVGPPCHLGMN